MAIKIIQRGVMKCDKCHVLMGIIKCTKELMGQFDTDSKYVEIFCSKCADPKDIEDLLPTPNNK